jgi:hypothetical protein
LRSENGSNHALIVHLFVPKNTKASQANHCLKGLLIDKSMWFYKPASYPMATSACFL